MQLLRTCLLGFLLLCMQQVMVAQTFPCNGRLYFSTNSGNAPTAINKVSFIPFGGVSYGQDYLFPGGNFNALGFNPADNYIYAVKSSSNEIVRLKADNTFEVIGSVPIVDELSSTAGDCTPDGLYLVHDNTLDQILVFEVENDFQLVNRIDLFWDPASDNNGPVTTRLDDIAIDPTNPTVAYSFHGSYFDSDLEPEESQGYLLSINLNFDDANVGMVTPIAPISDQSIKKIGSLIFGSSGELYAYGANAVGPDPSQRKFMLINKITGANNVFESSGPSGLNSDGCSCPYNISFQNIADPNFALCTDSETSYTLVVTNRFYQDINNISITDTFPEGMLITNISGSQNGNLATGTGVGTRYFQLDQVDLPARSELSINIEVEVIDLPIDVIATQAFIKELPIRFGEVIVSDDPSTSGFVGDPTRIFSDPQRLKEFDIEIIHPKDCLSADEGKINIAAPVLVPGATYDIGFKNEKFEELEQTVMINDQNGFLLDKLLPGEYSIYKITPQTTSCSFAMKDTSITVIAPNEMIKAEVTTNSPICEGEDLAFATEIFPTEGGTVSWEGPYPFLSSDLSNEILAATADNSGPYEMTFTYGVCEQVKTLDIEVAPPIEASIGGGEEFCERDSMILSAEGNGNLAAFVWTDPQGIEYTDSLLNISYANEIDGGVYQLIIDNGSCKDTTRQLIVVHPSPTLDLDPQIKTDFCEPLTLQPMLSGDQDIIYSWSPADGLSCSDCSNPEVIALTTGSYQLNVTNATACQDSANVLVRLDTENLIYTPNTFSPNVSGDNDHFQLFLNCGVASIRKFEVYDRNGSVVYDGANMAQIDNKESYWNGTINGKAASPGVYPYQLEIELVDGSERRIVGHVTILP